MMERLRKFIIASKWRKPSKLPETFFGFPAILPYQQELIGGDPDRDCYQWTIDEHLKNYMLVESALSLACGHGHVERLLAERGVFKECLGLDLAPGAVDEASTQST